MTVFPTERLDRVATVQARIGWKALTADEYVDEGIAFLATPNIKPWLIDFEDVNRISKFRYDESPELRLRVGDVLLAKDGSTLGIVNVVRALPAPATVNGSIAVLRPRAGMDAVFLRFALESTPVRERIGLMKNGMGVPHLFQWDIRRFDIPCPSNPVQRRVAEFLDDQCTRIDEIVALREEQIADLASLVDSEVWAAVTGVGEPGPRQATRMEWLGDIPISWQVATVGSQYEVLLGKMLNDGRTRGERLRPYLRNTNVQWDRIDIGDLAEMDFPLQERRRYEVLPGDLLICEGGQPGRAAVWRGEVDEIYFQKALHRARPRKDSNVRWLFYLLWGAVKMNVFGAQGQQATIAHLTGEQLRAQRFPFPSAADQARLVERLDECLQAVQEVQAEMRAQVVLMRERKRALITAAVTGEFDVTTAGGRGVVA